jgi:hypothetical protein
MTKLALRGAVAALLATTATAAPAAVIGTLSFDTPNGTALSNVDIDVDVTLSLDPSSDALTTDGDGNVTSGLTEADIIAAGADPTEVARTFLTVAFECSGNFTASCISGPPYAFDFDLSQFYFAQNFDLQPGNSFGFRFGVFSPTGGNAPAGTYTFYNAIAYIGIQENDGDVFYSDIAQTCPNQNSACAFTRTIEAAPVIPEPSSWAMMIAGFGLAGWVARSRRSMLATA